MIYARTSRSTQLKEDVNDFKVKHKEYLEDYSANAELSIAALPSGT